MQLPPFTPHSTELFFRTVSIAGGTPAFPALRGLTSQAGRPRSQRCAGWERKRLGCKRRCPARQRSHSSLPRSRA